MPHNQTQYADFIQTVRRLQPRTLILPGPDGTLADVGEINPGVYPLWNAVDVPAVPAGGVFQCNPNPGCIPCPKHPTGQTWLPVESDGTIQGCPLCKTHWWFWAGSPKRNSQPEGGSIPHLTARQLYSKYLRTVGRGCNMIMNIPPNQTGLVAPEHLAAITAFGEARNAFEPAAAVLMVPDPAEGAIELSCGPLPHTGNASSLPNSVVLNFSSSLETAAVFDTLVSMEDLSQGQRIAEYSLDVFIHGQQVDTGWQSLPALGKTVGHKVIDGLPFPMPTSPVKSAVEAVRFTCVAAGGDADTVLLKSFAAFLAKPPATTS